MYGKATLRPRCGNFRSRGLVYAGGQGMHVLRFILGSLVLLAIASVVLTIRPEDRRLALLDPPQPSVDDNSAINEGRQSAEFTTVRRGW